MGKVEKFDKFVPKIKETSLRNGLKELAELLGEFASQFDITTSIRRKDFPDRVLYEFIAGDRRIVVETKIPGEIPGTSRVYVQYNTIPDARVQRITVNPRGLVKVAVGRSLESNAIKLLREELRMTHGRPHVTRFRQR